jgi:lipoprotein-anchoring transpeptidase ErfK/SrfK
VLARGVGALGSVIALVMIGSTFGSGRPALSSESAARAPTGSAVDPSVHLVVPPAGHQLATVPTALPPSSTTVTTIDPSTEPSQPVGPATSMAEPRPTPPAAAPHSRAAVAPQAAISPRPVAINDPSAVATALVPTLPLYAAPGAPAPVRTLANPNYLGAPLVLLVAGYREGWVQAYVPVRPNGSTAWIPSADVSIGSVPDHIVVDIAARQLTLYSDNVPVFETPVAPGAPASPTPTGVFFVTFVVRVTTPADVYGPYALGLSAFSNTYFSFDGGPGQIAIHGTNQPWVIGTYASHGCVRLPNAAISVVAQRVLPGTPVVIRN